MSDSSPINLKRNIGLWATINYILSLMIGSGIFISPTATLKYSGSVGFCLVVWVLSGIISLFGALCYAELGTVVQKSGSDYAYLMETFGRTHRFWGPLPAFLCSWVYICVLRPSEICILLLLSAEYLFQPFTSLIGMPHMNLISKKLIAVLILGIMTYINVVSVKLFTRISGWLSFGKLLACLLIIGGGLYKLVTGDNDNLKAGFKGTTVNPGSIVLAFYNGLWAYDGWACITTITEEIKKPEKNIPKAIIIAVPLVMVLNVLMNLAYMIVLSPDEMISSDAVAIDFSQRVLGPFLYVVTFGIALSTFGCALTTQFGVGRLCYVSGRSGHFLEATSYVQYRNRTPAAAIALEAVLSLVFISLGDVGPLIEFASFLLWIFYGASVICLLVLRRVQPNIERPYKVPLIIAYVTLITAFVLAIIPLIREPPGRFCAGTLFIIAGIFVYIPFVYYKYRPAFMGKLTYLIQVLFEVVPPNSEENAKIPDSLKQVD